MVLYVKLMFGNFESRVGIKIQELMN